LIQTESEQGRGASRVEPTSARERKTRMSNGNPGGTVAMDNMPLRNWTIGTIIASLVLTGIILGAMFS